jgi:hypothetical protein
MAKRKSRNKAKINRVTFHNKISSNFREIHVDGALGGLTPKGLININFFAERFPIPKSTDFEILNGNSLGERLGDSSDSKDGIIREYEFGVYMDVDTAKELMNWLNEKIQQAEIIKSENANVPRSRK